MTLFEWIVVIGLAVAVWQLIAINRKLEAVGHVLMDLEKTQREIGVAVIKQGLPENHPFR